MYAVFAGFLPEKAVFTIADSETIIMSKPYEYLISVWRRG
jgi:hypothetical protein